MCLPESPTAVVFHARISESPSVSTTQLISFLEAWAWVFSGDVVSVRTQLLTVKDCYAAITMSSFSREEHELNIMPSTLRTSGGCGIAAPLHSYFGTAVNMVMLVLAAATLSLTALLLLILRTKLSKPWL